MTTDLLMEHVTAAPGRYHVKLYDIWERREPGAPTRLNERAYSIGAARRVLEARADFYRVRCRCDIGERLSGRGFVAERDGKLVASALITEVI